MQASSSFPWKNYLGIKYWPSWLGYFSLRILILFPYPVQLEFGKFIGTLFYYLAPYRRLIASTNIDLCFPDWSKEKKGKILKKHFQAIGMAIFDTAINWWGNPKKLSPYIHFAGIQHVKHHIQAGHNIIMLSFHFTSVEAPGRLFMEHQAFAATYQQLRNPLFNALMKKARENNIKIAIERRDIRKMIKTIKSQIPMWMAADQDLGIKNSVFVPFFNHLAATQTSPMKLAKLTGAKVLPVLINRIEKKLQVQILPALENFPSGNVEKDAILLNTLLENNIREYPEQYLWTHRKYKTRPNNEAKLYPPKPRRLKRKNKNAHIS